MYISEDTAISFKIMNKNGKCEKRLVRFFRDEFPDDPRYYSDFNTLALFTRYAIGDIRYSSHYTPEIFWRNLVIENAELDYKVKNSIDDLTVDQCIQHMKPYMICLPIWLVEHGTIQLKVADEKPDRWDSSFAGWYVITKKQAKQIGYNEWTEATKAMLRRYMLSELDEYNAFLSGDVWGYQLYTYEEDEGIWCKLTEEQYAEDGCGFYGSNLLKNGMLNEIDGLRVAIESDSYPLIPVSKKKHCYVTYEFETEAI